MKKIYFSIYYIIISGLLIGGLVLGYSDYLSEELVWGGIMGEDRWRVITYSFFGIVLHSKAYNDEWQLVKYNEYNMVAIILLVSLFLIAYLLPIIVVLVRKRKNKYS